MSDKQLDPGSSLLLFSIGPVQEFIAAARSTRDLWSGSYLLSTLAATALRKIKDHVVFPSVENQPLVAGNKNDLSKFLTPTLPNRFLAVFPKEVNATAKAEELKETIRQELKIISDKVQKHLEEKTKNVIGVQFNSARFEAQAKRILEVQWQVLEVPNSVDKVRELAKLLPKDIEGKYEPRKGLDNAQSLSDCWGPLNSILAWLLDGTKSLRSFDAWRTGSWVSGMEYIKDGLTGKEEAVFTVDSLLSDQDLDKAAGALGLNKQGGLKAGETFGAANTIKRFWDVAYLTTLEGLPSDPDNLRRAHPMPNTHSIAKYNIENDGGNDASDESEKYFAIIAMDGDEMGKWISGQKFDKVMQAEDHAEFSKILNEFSLEDAAGLVEDSAGRLIYSGGDDVLAMVPAGNALNCAQDLRNAFVERFPKDKYKDMDASAGIAIAHYKSPLQDVVKAAHAAEKRAKRATEEGGLGRGAVAFTIMKRSGEILEWGTKWTEDDKDSAGIHLVSNLLKDLKSGKLNSRFPHKLEAQLTPYLPPSTSSTTDDTSSTADSPFYDNFAEILKMEVTHTLKRNAGGKLGETKLEDFTAYWNSLDADFKHRKNLDADFKLKLTLFINILRTAAWMVRGDKTESHSENKTDQLATI